MLMERCDGNPDTLLLVARKRKKSLTYQYLISVEKTQLNRGSEGIIGLVKSNVMGTEFTLYETSPTASASKNIELAGMVFNNNRLGMGTNGPQGLTTCVIPGMNWNYGRVEFKLRNCEGELINMWRRRKMNHVVELHAKRPTRSPHSQSHVLDFDGRVTEASTYNFQLINVQASDYIVLQFGRTGNDDFILDFRYPLCPVQAFAIVLSTLGKKLGRSD